MWIWNQANGNLSRNGELVGTGYAGGSKGKHPEAVNNPAFEYVRGVGPLPKGTYTIGDFIDHPHLGKLAAQLTPSPENVMYGRSGFYIHGDTEEMNQSASDGCPVLPHSVRVAIAESDDKEFQVV
jgi:hypothetical protein